MAIITPNMALTAWNSSTDPYNHDQLAANFVTLDQHDHSPGNGVQINGATGIKDGSIPFSKLSNFVYKEKSIPGMALQDSTVTSDKTEIIPYASLQKNINLSNVTMSANIASSGTVRDIVFTINNHGLSAGDFFSVTGFTVPTNNFNLNRTYRVNAVSTNTITTINNSLDTTSWGSDQNNVSGTFYKNYYTATEGNLTQFSGSNQFNKTNNAGYDSMASTNGLITIPKSGIYSISASFMMNWGTNLNPGGNQALSLVIRSGTSGNYSDLAYGSGGFELFGDDYPVTTSAIVNLSQNQTLSLWYRFKWSDTTPTNSEILQYQSNEEYYVPVSNIKFYVTWIGRSV